MISTAYFNNEFGEGVGGGTLVYGFPDIPLFYYWSPYHYGEILFLIVVFQPPRGILSTLRLQVPSGMSEDEHACYDSGEDIIHA